MKKLLAALFLIPSLALAQNIPQPLEVSQSGTWTNACTQSGTWTVQPGNTANTTAWLVTGTGGTFPVTDSGGSLTVDGALQCNAGTNLNTSALALESGGNLATIAGKDFATQTTLALIKAKTDNLDTALSGIKTGTDKIPASPSTDRTTAAAPFAVRLSDGSAFYNGATETTLSSLNSKVTACNTGAVTVSSSALPTGASTSALQTTLNGHVDGVEGLLTTIDSDTGAISTAAASIDSKITACNTGAVTISGALPAGTNAIGKVDHSTTGIATGRKTVATAGTREALASSTSAKWVCLTAETDNAGVVVVGGSAVVATLATRQGTPLDAGDDICLPVDNLADVYLDVTSNGEGVTYTYGS